MAIKLAINRHLLAGANITIYTGSLLSTIDAGKVTIEKEGQKTELPCNTLIIAVSYQFDKSLAQDLKGKIAKVFTIGDNLRPAKVLDKVHESFHTARLLEELTTLVVRACQNGRHCSMIRKTIPLSLDHKF